MQQLLTVLTAGLSCIRYDYYTVTPVSINTLKLLHGAPGWAYKEPRCTITLHTTVLFSDWSESVD